MSGHWSSRHAIQRDLARAQGGRGVPPAGERADPLAPADRPPRIQIREEIEEEYFRHWSAAEDADGDARVTESEPEPDLSHIRQMLDMLRDEKISFELCKENSVAVISKLNPHSSEFMPCAPHAPAPAPEVQPDAVSRAPATKSPKKKPNLKKHKNRNIALESILRAIENSTEGPRPLLKPNDIVSNEADRPAPHPDRIHYGACAGSVDRDRVVIHSKVNTKNNENRICVEFDPVDNTPTDEPTGKVQFTEQSVSPPRAAAPLAHWPAAAMFKRRRAPVPAPTPPPAPEPVPPACRLYRPSAASSRLYARYVEHARLRDQLHTDIWTRASNRMKLLDDRKRVMDALLAVEAARAAEQAAKIEVSSAVDAAEQAAQIEVSSAVDAVEVSSAVDAVEVSSAVDAVEVSSTLDTAEVSSAVDAAEAVAAGDCLASDDVHDEALRLRAVRLPAPTPPRQRTRPTYARALEALLARTEDQ